MPDAEQVEMAAWVFYRDSLCPGCAQDLGLVTDPHVTWLVDDIVCYGCWSKEHRQRQMQESAGKSDGALDGVKVFVRGPKQLSGGGRPDGS